MSITRPFRYIPTVKRQDFNYEFVDYTWFKNFLNPQECEQVKPAWKDENMIEAIVGN